MARTSRRQPNSYRGGRVVGNLAYDERYAERRAPRRESEQREQPREEFIRPPRRQEKKAVRPRVRERQRVSGVLALGFAALAAMVVVVLMSYAQLTSISADVVSMQKELKTLDAEHVALLTQYERTFDRNGQGGGCRRGHEQAQLLADQLHRPFRAGQRGALRSTERQRAQPRVHLAGAGRFQRGGIFQLSEAYT